MKLFSSIAAAVSLSAAGLTMFTPPVKASTNCYGNEYYVSCTYSGYENGQYVSCFGSGTPGNIYWTCNSF